MRVVDFLKLSISYEPERVLAAEIYLHTFRRHWYICWIRSCAYSLEIISQNPKRLQHCLW